MAPKSAVMGLDAEDAADNGAGGAPEKPKFVYHETATLPKGKKKDMAPSELGIELGTDITGDGGIFKRITTEGTPNTKPPEYAHIKCHYAGYKIHKDKWAKFDASRDNMKGLPDKNRKTGLPVHVKNAAGQDLWKRDKDDTEGTPNQSEAATTKEGPMGFYVEKKFEFKKGGGECIKGWDKVVASMCKGEKCTVIMRADYAYGAKGDIGTCDADEIPAHATLMYEMELVDWEEAEAPPAPPPPPPSGGCLIL